MAKNDLGISRKEKLAIAETMVDKINKYTVRTTAAIFQSTRGGEVTVNGNHACHAAMSSAAVQQSPVFGVAMAAGAKKEDPTYQEVASFLWEHPRSPYRPHIEALGEDFIIAKDGDIISGFVVLNTDFPTKALMNLAKSARVFCEHDHVLDFWKKYRGKGVEPSGLLFLMAFFYATDGSRRRPGHGPVDFASGEKINLRRVLGRWKKDEFDYKSGLMSSGTGYTGENSYFWCGNDGKFNIHENIRKAGPRTKAPTVFYKKYFEKTPEQLSDDDIIAFFKEAEAGDYDEYL